MAGEIKFDYRRGSSCYAIIRDNQGRVWNTSGGTGAFESPVSGMYSRYVISCSEQLPSAYYVGNVPAAVPAGILAVVAKENVTGTENWLDPTVAEGNIEWNGSYEMPLSDVVTSGQLSLFGPVKLTKGVMVQNFPIYLKSAADHITPLVSGIVSGQIIRNSGNWGPLQSGAFQEQGYGFYHVTLTSGDLNGDCIKLLFTGQQMSGGPASDPLPMAFVMQRASGSP